ncbi:MAG: 2,3-bisphosphoglycerate-independent phosphoglycerate mutase [Clostridiales Family XIII bacterium]|nr:2,3-bisphosphoglycerate-independent phosphoglycerate mutase [Clostridiales Family XIII bacterium]
MKDKRRPLMLMILDGFGLSDETRGNAIAAARKPHLDGIFRDYPHTSLGASGEAVGLPDGQMGNSEVGHLNIGAGRVVYQEYTRISKSVRDGDFFENPALNRAADRALENGGALHLLGLVSDGGVHSHNTHLCALLAFAKRKGLERVYVHAFLDGRDTPPRSAAGFLRELEAEIAKIGAGRIALLSGRYYAMDRDNRWERVQQAYDAISLGTGIPAASAAEAIESAYAAGESDEFVKPRNICAAGERPVTVQDGDSVIFFNFRPDRARELTRCFVDPRFAGFPREKTYASLFFVTMTSYDAEMPNAEVAYPPQTLDNTLGAYIAGLGLSQLRIAETEKYAHVTFFFNGGVEEPNAGEDRVLIDSPKVATYDLQPEMSAPAVTDEAIARIESGKYDLVVLNFANCDMVGHTGVLEAATKAVEAVDACIGRIAERVLARDGRILLTADHGNAERMIDDDGTPFTAHTTNPVPLALIAKEKAPALLPGGRLCDLAPTLLDLMDLPQPAEMTGRSLLDRGRG